MPDIIGQTISRYRMLSRLGGGGMGVVYEALDLDLGRHVALKFLPDDMAKSEDALTRFKREARAASALNHPHICTIHEIGEHEGRPFIVMERMRGTTLKHVISGQPMPVARALEIGAQIADALEAAHGVGIVHRDLKPDNIFVTDHGEAKLLDFGLAKQGLSAEASGSDVDTVQRDNLTSPGTTLGTVAYMSPEQAEGRALGPRSDLFSLGIVLYEMATGRRPFQGDSTASIVASTLRDDPAPIATHVPGVPAALEPIVRRCLEKDPAKRWPDAASLRVALEALRAEMVSGPRLATIPPGSRRRTLLLAGFVLLAVAGVAGWLYLRGARERWVRHEVLPQLDATVDRIQFLEEGRESWDAFLLARQIEAVTPDEPLLTRLRPRFSRPITITSDPPGALVSVRYYDEPDVSPLVLGRTPLANVAYPRGFTRLRLDLAGRPPVDDVVWNFSGENTFAYRIPAPGEIPEGMVFVPGGSMSLVLPGLDNLGEESTAAFLIDRHEVTNSEYKKFVDAGGYGDPQYWPHPFLDDGRELPRKDAMARLVDRTERPGPSTWELGSYPEGHDAHPVTGVSWYEAAAYAAWAGKSLPTVFHWNRVAYTFGSSRIVPVANLGGKELLPVGRTKSQNRYGVSDLAGNAREWVWNATAPGGQRLILGGGWNDPDYAFSDAYAQPPFDRSPTNGFRNIKPVVPEPNAAALKRTMTVAFRDFFKEKPVSDEVFAQYLRQFVYDRTPLDARVEEETEVPTGRRQKVTFAAAYGGERMAAYVFLPPRDAARTPYQVVVTFPGSGSISTRSSDGLEPGRLDFVPRTGRVLVWPIYKGTYERGGDLHAHNAEPTAFYKDYVVAWARDLSRTIDYLETRQDLDASRLAYYGLSWGGQMGAILPAVETRIRTNVLYVAGLGFGQSLPEVDEINYIGRVKQPTLILNAQLDFYFPAETSQRPMFELLGTPPAHKKRLVYPGGHSVPRTEMIKESLAWLDRYLGPVTRP